LRFFRAHPLHISTYVASRRAKATFTEELFLIDDGEEANKYSGVAVHLLLLVLAGFP
jgi:hypothetical protein